MVKRVLCLLLALMTVLLSAGAVSSADERERLQRIEALDEFSAFAIPNMEGVNDSAAFCSALQRAAEEAGVNVFRKVSGWSENDEPFVGYYLVMGNGRTSFFEAFSLRDDRFIEEEILPGHDWILATDDTGVDGGAHGALNDILGNDLCVMQPMEHLFDRYSVAGNYYVESASEDALAEFVARLESSLKSLNGAAEIEIIQGDVEGYYAGVGANFDFGFPIGLALFMLVIVVAYYQMSLAKENALLALYGNGFWGRWFRTSGRFLMVASLVSAGAALLGGLFVPGGSLALGAEAAANVLGGACLALGASLAAALAMRSSWVAALKGRRNVRGLAALCLVAKGAFCVVLIGVLGSVLMWQQVAEEEQAKYGNWAQTAQYGLFYPLTWGEDANDFEERVQAPIVFDLYPEAVRNGALYVDATQFKPIALANPGAGYAAMIVNPNYLKAFPVVDVQGDRVSIDESETDWILLVPEVYRDEEQGILEWWQLLRGASDEESSVWAADKAILGRTTTEMQEGQGVQIIWIADDQPAFAFDPEVGLEEGGNVIGPIIEVVTLENSAGLDRYGAVTGGLDGALKVPLVDGDPAKTYEQYRPLLEELDLTDNLKQIVTVESAVFEIIQAYRDEAKRLLLQAAAILAVALFVSVQSAALLFETNARRAAVKRFYGYGFFGRQGVPLAICGAMWLAVAAAMVAFNGPLGWPGGGDPLDPAQLGASLAVLAAIDFAVFAVALVAVERRCTVDVLKGVR